MDGVQYISARVICIDQDLTGSYATALTGGIEADGIFDVSGMSQITIYREFTPGAAETNNTMEVIVESSIDNGVTWHQEGQIDVSTPATSIDSALTFVSDSISAGTTYSGVPVRMALDTVKARFRIKETGIAANAGTATLRFVPRYV